ncbi:MAG TPA: type II toxin-antitoxin system prevent-host-death family antitoxin [Solirubrobacteraceae bacterium]|jgi:prevent-host-death family protein
MPIANVRTLQHTAKDLLDRVERDREPFVITRKGVPIAALVPIDSGDAERYLLSTAPALLEMRREVEAGSGETQPLQEMAGEFGVELADVDAQEAASEAGEFELVEQVAEVTGWSPSQARQALEATIEVVSGELASGREVALAGFGKFSVSRHAGRQGRNPATGEALVIPSKAAKFSAANALKKRLNS